MRVSKALVAISLVVGAFTIRSPAQTVTPRPLVAGDILVKFRPGADANERANAHRAAAATALVEIPRTGVQRVRVAVGDESAAIARYRRNPNVLYAEPNFIRRIPMPSALAVGSPLVPGDHYFDEQWALHNTGQGFYCIPWFGGELCLYSGTPDADIDAPEAWEISTGSSSVTVAVIDSGVDYLHPDLAANYAGGDDFVFADGDPMDDHGHGTHVSGTIAAALENLTGTPPAAEGVAGVAPYARILAYKVCRSDGTCDDFAIQQAIARAITDGAKVINMSLGEADYSQSLDDAVQDAWLAGLVIVAGAGNDGTTDLFYPAALDHVLSVAAFDQNHQRASFSNYGSWVDLSAPGNVIMSTYPMAACSGSTVPGDIGCYTWNSGTSMATPHVSGAAALVWSRSDVTSNSQVVDILLNSADGQGVADVRLDSWTIHGGLNLHDAVSHGLTNQPPHADAGPDQTVLDSDRDGTELVSLDGSASSDPDGTIVSYAWREGSTSIGVGVTTTVALSVGVHTVTLDVTDDHGGSATDSVVVTVNHANQVALTASTAQATEAGPANGVFTVTRTGDAGASLTVHYTVAGTALAGTDYASLPGTVTISAESATATVAVTPIDDAAFESDESVILTLGAAAGYSLGSPSVATVTIVSDDLPPDLLVVAMTAPAIAGPDTDIVVTDTTKNQGTGPSLPSETGFYWSTNTTLDAGDTWLGSRPVSSLGPGVTNVASTTLHLPTSIATGSYYVLAKADWESVVNEGVETNNVRTSGVIKVGPDLIVSAIAIPASAAPGATISVADSTRNQGAGAAASSSTGFYLSANLSIGPTDSFIGSRPVGELAPNGNAAASTPLQIPADTLPGSYYVIGRADWNNAVAETTETNNSKASGVIRIGGDLVVASISAPATAAANGAITVADTTRNQGAAPVPGSVTGFYLSTNGTYNSTDAFLGSRVVGSLGPSATDTASTPFVVPPGTVPGSYYVVGVADSGGAVAESLENNNTRGSGVVRIGPDLVVTALTAPSSAVAGTSISARDTTKNQGADTAPASVTSVYLSANPSLDAGDQLLATRPVASLGPGLSETGSVPLTIPAATTAGTYYIIAKGDGNDVMMEALENNNTRLKSISIAAAP